MTAVLEHQPDLGQAGSGIATWEMMYIPAGAPVVLQGGVCAGGVAGWWFAYPSGGSGPDLLDGITGSA